jgi:2-dehydro-3-deoxyglucarate aldolase
MTVRPSFRSRLLAGETLLGTMLTMPLASVAEILSDAGFDWLFVDGEHGPLATADILGILQAVGDRTPCLVRVPAAGEVAIKQVLDLGADGIIVPQVSSAAEAAQIVQWARYSPAGSRGVGLARAHGYGRRFQEYIETANDRTVVVVQAEHIRAVENIEAIVQVPGVDAVLLGPYDLSASMGKIGQIDDPAVVAAIERITTVCRAAKKPLGCFGVSAASVQQFMQQGYTLVTAGVDTLFLAQAAGQMLKAVQQ